MSDNPFKIDVDERMCVLLIDGGMLDAAEPVQVSDDYGPVRLADDPVLRIRMDQEEARRLWRLLDNTIGAHVREGEVVREVFDRTRREDLDTRLPTTNELGWAVEVLEHPSSHDEDELAEAQRVVTVYERAHGTREGS